VPSQLLRALFSKVGEKGGYLLGSLRILLALLQVSQLLSMKFNGRLELLLGLPHSPP
jgi:hypothetical protein